MSISGYGACSTLFIKYLNAMNIWIFFKNKWLRNISGWNSSEVILSSLETIFFLRWNDPVVYLLKFSVCLWKTNLSFWKLQKYLSVSLQRQSLYWHLSSISLVSFARPMTSSCDSDSLCPRAYHRNCRVSNFQCCHPEVTLSAKSIGIAVSRRLPRSP